MKKTFAWCRTSPVHIMNMGEIQLPAYLTQVSTSNQNIIKWTAQKVLVTWNEPSNFTKGRMEEKFWNVKRDLTDKG